MTSAAFLEASAALLGQLQVCILVAFNVSVFSINKDILGHAADCFARDTELLFGSQCRASWPSAGLAAHQQPSQVACADSTAETHFKKRFLDMFSCWHFSGRCLLASSNQTGLAFASAGLMQVRRWTSGRQLRLNTKHLAWTFAAL